MITGCDYYKPDKERAQETIPREQDTPQDKKRLKTTPALKKRRKKERAATTSHDKSQESNSKGARVGRGLHRNRKPR
jgi:hypothetical protein